ncbi:MAG: RuBisCO large subunit C-terminal-like domain-containing protein, partial [Candidatus Micrarchaeota archaeon]|nr:RuBisCO large subunit C-terminal-like domain-containing protein [Candidatus Micrarchaeota archaeon]
SAILHYSTKNRKSFEDKVVPYVFGGGIFYKETSAKPTFKHHQLSLNIETTSLSQLITASTGMLRYSPDCVLEKIQIIDSDKVIARTSEQLNVERPLLGAIIKPSLGYNSKIAEKIIESAAKAKLDFVKDDDASEYSKQEARKIKRLANNVPYLQKIAEPQKLVGEFSMVVPWVDGWTLLQKMSKKSITTSHCAALSPQVSWYSHVIFSRLAGASLVIVPDSAFDDKFDLKLALEAASRQIIGVNSVRLIISGGITPSRIVSVLKKIDKKQRKYVGFAVGSWLLSYSNNIAKNFELLQNAMR